MPFSNENTIDKKTFKEAQNFVSLISFIFS